MTHYTRSLWIASAMAPSSRAGTNMPLLWSSINSGIPEIRVDITAISHICASSRTVGIPSLSPSPAYTDGATK